MLTLLIKRKFFFFSILASLTMMLFLLLPSCSSNDEIENLDLKKWIESEHAFDLNGDDIIDNLDYELYCSFLDWKISNDLYDFNGDKRISFDDYVVYNNYLSWINSDKKKDINEDNQVNEIDFLNYTKYFAVSGKVRISNYTYDGDSFKLINSGIHLRFLGDYFKDIEFEIGMDGGISYKIPESFTEIFKEDLPIIEGIIKNSCIDVVNNEVVLKLDIHNNGALYDYDIILEKRDNGYFFSTTITLKEKYCLISFDIVYTEENEY